MDLSVENTNSRTYYVHDTMRHGPQLVSSQFLTLPKQVVLKKSDFKPLNFHSNPVVKSSNLGNDILNDRLIDIDFDDFLGDQKLSVVSVDFHCAMEDKLKLSF